MHIAVLAADPIIRQIVLEAINNLNNPLVRSCIPTVEEILKQGICEQYELVFTDKVNFKRNVYLKSRNCQYVVIVKSKSGFLSEYGSGCVHIIINPEEPVQKNIEIISNFLKNIIDNSNEYCRKKWCTGKNIEIGKVNALAIGSSAGGPDALSKLWQMIKRPLTVPVFIVQHLPDGITNFFAEQIRRNAPMPVIVAQMDSPVLPGTIYIAPGGKHLRVKKSSSAVLIDIYQGDPINNCIPSIDILFSSVAKVYGDESLAVVLTGMGEDGKNGCKDIRNSKGGVIVQDKNSSLVWGIPGAVASAGLADAILSLDEIGDFISNNLT